MGTLFGNYNDLDPVPDLGDEDDMGTGTFSSRGDGVGTRIMSRQQAIERVNLARRRRLKLGGEIPDTGPSTSVDILGGIIDCQSSLFHVKTPEKIVPRKNVSINKSSYRVRSAVVTSTTWGTGQVSNGSSDNLSSSSVVTNGNSHNNTASEQTSASDNIDGNNDDIYNNIVEAEAEQSDNLPTLSDAGLRNLVARSGDNESTKNTPEKLPPLSDKGLAKLSEIYDPANPGEPSDDEEDLVIDDKKDTENIPLPDELTDIPLPVDE